MTHPAPSLRLITFVIVLSIGIPAYSQATFTVNDTTGIDIAYFQISNLNKVRIDSSGNIIVIGSGGNLKLTPPASGSPVWTPGTNTGTPAVTATSPLAISSSTGNITCSTCATTASVMTTAPYSNSSSNFTSVSGLSFAVDANTNYVMTCQIPYSVSVSAGLTFVIQVTDTSSPTGVQFTFSGASGSMVYAEAQATAFSTPMTLGSVGSTTTAPATLTMGLQNGSTAGTIQIQAKNGATGTLTIPKYAFCVLQ